MKLFLASLLYFVGLSYTGIDLYRRSVSRTVAHLYFPSGVAFSPFPCIISERSATQSGRFFTPHKETNDKAPCSIGASLSGSPPSPPPQPASHLFAVTSPLFCCGTFYFERFSPFNSFLTESINKSGCFLQLNGSSAMLTWSFSGLVVIFTNSQRDYTSPFTGIALEVKNYSLLEFRNDYEIKYMWSRSVFTVNLSNLSEQ